MMGDFFKTIQFQNVWIFITGRCNLRCDYCFYSYRENKDISWSIVKVLLGQLDQRRKYSFVFSGGEPLLRWDILRKTVCAVGKQFRKSEISVQTNMLLADKKKLRFLRDNNCCIEPGIDGVFASNRAHRKGFDVKQHEVYLRNIKDVAALTIRMNPTMTVHPDQTGAMWDNFRFLVSLGLHSIEIHPAFMAPWTPRSSNEFIRQYKRIIAFEQEQGLRAVCKSYSVDIPMSMDLVVQPDGSVLPNWTFLRFSRAIRDRFIMGVLKKNGFEVNQGMLKEYLPQFRFFFKQPRTYRDFSNFNARLILERVNNARQRDTYKQYERLCGVIQGIDRMVLKGEYGSL